MSTPGMAATAPRRGNLMLVPRRPRNNVIAGFEGFGGLSGLGNVFYNPQDQSWYECTQDGGCVRVSGSPPRTPAGTSTPPSSSGSGVSSNVAAILAAVNGLGTQFVGLWRENTQLRAQQLQAQYGVGAPGAAASGGGLTGLVAQATNFATNNPVLVAVFIGGILLYMAPSPRRK